MLIIHGDDLVAARNHLNESIAVARDRGKETRRFSANALDLTTLTQVLEATTLFGKEPLLIIEGLLSLPKSKNRDNLIEFLKDYQEHNLILFEDKVLSAATVKPFPKATAKEHKPMAIIFTFLDSLRPGGALRSLKLLTDLENTGEPAELIFAMLVRQVRLLIQALEPNNLKVAPWQKNKLVVQARAFGEKKLLDLHDRLYRIDKGIKTGQNPLALSTQLFDLIVNL